MTKPLLNCLVLLLLVTSVSNCNSPGKKADARKITYDYLKKNFRSPDSKYGVNCWWWWLNGNVNKAAISKDLEAMKSRNFQGAMIFDAGGHNHRGNKDIPDGPLFGSDEWNELFVFALDEAKRLGLSIGFNIQSGWNLGGPRVSPEYSAKQLVYTTVQISGNKKVSQKLDLPLVRNDFYKDIAVLAFPAVTGMKAEAISDLELKLAYRELGGSAPDCRFLLFNKPRYNVAPDENMTIAVKKDDIQNLMTNLNDQGVLDWDVPDGEWTVIRIGYTCTGSHVSTSSNNWQGSVLDYMSTEAFDFYWQDVVEPIFKAAGEHVGHTLKFMETDSWECGGMNWTDKFIEEFRNYRGYDITNYLPIIAGYVVENVETSNAFLADFRKTLGDLVANNHYARFAEHARQNNMGIQPESAGPHAGPMDGIKNYGFSDIVMSEFWSPSPHRPNPENRYFLKQASSAAHVYGKNIVGAESFTTIGPQWNDELWHDQKSAFDHEICAGLNRLYFHTFTCSPPEMGLPGQEYFAGTHVNPQVTWWDQSGPFIDYMHRTQLLVQNGNFQADVLYYYGDHVPNVFSIKASDPAEAMPGFDYDVCDENILLQLKLKKGKLLVPGGIEYELLVLPDHKVLSMAALVKVEELLNAGAQVIAYKPEKLVSLVGGLEEQTRFHALANKIWGEEDAVLGERSYGKGNIAWGVTARDYLLSNGKQPDFVVVDCATPSDFDYIHYKFDGKDLYFITNQSTERETITCQFRVSGFQPELWDAQSGSIRKATAFTQSGTMTQLPLTMDPYGAVFVVFNEKIDYSQQGEGPRNYADYKTIQRISGAWTVHFDPRWGGPETVIFPELIDWTKHSDEGIKYYSGSASYDKSFDINFELESNERYYLKLGSIKDVGIAEVKMNGKDLGILWTSPFRVDISDALVKGKNELEIKVVNSWYNRIAGDELKGSEKRFTATNIVVSHDFRGREIKDLQLEPSGLLGPVSIQIPMSNKNLPTIDSEKVLEWSKSYRNWKHQAGGNPSGIDSRYAHKISLVWNPHNETYSCL